MGLDGFYRVLKGEIRGANGTIFNFEGLSTHTIDSLKSYEGYDICWVEEAHVVCEQSWKILIPTIRKPGSEIWISFNPDLDTDAVYHRFIVHPPHDCVSMPMNYMDNPWFSVESNNDRLHCKKYYPDDYDNVWLGACRPAALGAIYYKEVETAIRTGHICRLPYDPFLKVHTVWDLGWNDSMGIALVQKGASDIRIIDYLESDHHTYDWFSAELRERHYNWGRVWLPHDGFAGDPKTGKTVQQILQKLGWDVADRQEIVELPVESGIKLAKMTFPRIYFDNSPCPERRDGDTLGGTNRLLECMKRYKRVVTHGINLGGPLHDEYAHGADVIRYICCNIEKMTNEDRRTLYTTSGLQYGPRDPGVGL